MTSRLAAVLTWTLFCALHAQEAVYTSKTPGPGGTGKVYMGREISHVVGHQAITWLERPERIGEELPDEVIRNMEVKPTDVIADIGAGSGYFSLRLAKLVTNGKVYAVDIQDEMLTFIQVRASAEKLANVISHKGSIQDTKLPENSIDVALMVDAYHEFSHPREMMESIVKALKPGGRLIQLEYRGEDPKVAIKPLHKMTQWQVKREMAAVGLSWKETREFLPMQHFFVFVKE
ncbi:MAG: Ubiquinone/menaquinone biosynthesis C-methylase UbiE [Verrucomicrobia bacterium]|jgi:precorrin-6B methylase 2|nr:MAG: Ubiquinone/menaquinone biosynthesis C-methylase UbiE [Verrucomicrobiota bacterium]